MIVNDIYAKVGDAKSTDEIVVASQQEYYNGAPVNEYGNSKLFKEVVDVLNDNGKLVILVK
jgi:hypothetical protein